MFKGGWTGGTGGGVRITGGGVEGGSSGATEDERELGIEGGLELRSEVSGDEGEDGGDGCLEG